MLETLISALIVLAALLLFGAALLIFRAIMYGRVPPAVAGEGFDAAVVAPELVAEHLSTALQAKTVSLENGLPADERAFDRLHRALRDMYPHLHGALEREVVSEWSLLYTWPGRDPALEPVLLCGHLDVVPSDPANQADWTHEPFSGAIADGHVWGRGALDMKSTVIAVLEAVEALARAGFRPERTLYLAFGQDEETSGNRGARQIAALLAERGVRLAAVLDEGAAVMDGMLPGVALPVALVGIAEKGYASVALTVEGRAGHSSMPPPHTAIGVLARAVARLEQRPLPTRMAMPRLMFQELGAFLPFTTRLALANPFLFGRAVEKRLLANPQTAALARTTIAATMIEGGVKDNILPARACAVINCRLMPGDTRAALVEHIRRAVDDEAVQVTLRDESGWEASPVSPVDGPAYESLVRIIRQAFPEAVTAPYLVSGATDARYYAALCPAVYRFSPYLLDAALLKTVHGVDERVRIEDLGRMVGFYTGLIQAWAG